MKNLKISRKLMLAFTVIIAMVLMMSGAVYESLSSVQSATTANENSHAILAAADDALSALVEKQNAVRGYIATGDSSFLPRIKSFQTSFDAAADQLGRLDTVPETMDSIAALRDEAATIATQENQVIGLAQNPITATQARAALLTTGRLTKARATIKAIIDPQLVLVASRSAAQDSAMLWADFTLAGGCLLSVLAALAMGWLLSGSIGQPVTLMTAAMGRLAKGDHSVKVPAAGRRDEVGLMADAVQAFKDAAIEKLSLEKEAKALQTRADAERQKAEAERAEAAGRLEFVVSSLAQALEKLSKGDLVLRLVTPFSTEYEKLRTDFNAAMDTLQETMKAIAANTQGVRSGAGEITQASDDLSRRTEQQAASLEETAAALDQITATVRRTAGNANNARAEVVAAKSDAESAGEVVRETVTAMNGIDTSSKQIGNIIGVIDEIAFQTNLLPLNAGVEAARAGDAGRGFAVVATEVRALAQRSADSAKEIKTLISTSSQQVDSGVKLVAETGGALERIFARVLKLNELVGDIAASAQEQATGLNEVNTAVNQMDQVTQQNAAMVEQSTAASHSLAGEAEELSRLVGQFSIGEVDQANVPKRIEPAPKPVIRGSFKPLKVAVMAPD